MYRGVQCTEVFSVRMCSMYGGVQCKDVDKIWKYLM